MHNEIRVNQLLKKIYKNQIDLETSTQTKKIFQINYKEHQWAWDKLIEAWKITSIIGEYLLTTSLI